MTEFSLLAPEWQYLLAGLLFLVTMTDFVLCIYKFLRLGRKKERLVDVVLLILILCFSAFVSAAKEGLCSAPFPWVFCLIAAVLVLVYVLVGVRREYRESLEILTPSSIKQTLDNLNSGILYTDARGRAVLVNYTMGELVAQLSGSYPQIYEDLILALNKAEKLDEYSGVYRLPDGKIWRFQNLDLSDPNLVGFTQITAQDITELYATNKELEEENEALGIAIEKMRHMLSLVAERVREKELLDIKVSVHNDIGNSLIALSGLMKGGVGEANEELHILQRAVSLFAGGGISLPGTMEDVRRQASELKLKLIIDGPIPQNDELRSLIAAATRECLTNCVRHAKGSVVSLNIAEEEGYYTVIITNNGEQPTSPIIEGGGLSSLRHRVEEAKGEMIIAHSPCFSLTLHLREGRAGL